MLPREEEKTVNSFVTPAVLPDGNGGSTVCPELLTEGELIVFFRIPEISKSKDYHNVVENLKRMHDLPRIHKCGKLLYPREAVIDSIRYKENWPWYATRSIKNIQKSVRQLYDIRKLRFLLYASRLESQDIARIKQDDAGVIWLGKS